MSKDRVEKGKEKRNSIRQGDFFFFLQNIHSIIEKITKKRVAGKWLAFKFLFIIRERRKGGDREKELECRQETFSLKHSSSFKQDTIAYI